MLDPRFNEINSVNDFKVAMRTWQGDDCECNSMFFMFAAEQLIFLILYRYVIVYIIVHPRHLSIVRASFHRVLNQMVLQIVLCTNPFVATQTDVN